MSSDMGVTDTYEIGTIRNYTRTTGTAMSNRNEQIEKRERAERLKIAREASNLGGYRKLSTRFGWNENTYKSHERGSNGFSVTTGREYAKVFGVSFDWLYFGRGEMRDQNQPLPNIADVPLISFVSAGQLTDQSAVFRLTDYPTIPAIDLPQGRWIALRVEGDSMNKVSPPESIIFVNLDDRRLVPNACYVVCDETGATTYKRYRPNEDPPFHPASYHDVSPPDLEDPIRVIGRVRRTVLEM